jgi:hypothetical protein
VKNNTYIQKKIDRKSRQGGKVFLRAGEYQIASPVIVDVSSFTLEGESWACNVDPNGVFESPFGTKLKLKGRDIPSIKVGNDNVLSGTVIKNIGIQGDITGMDTRELLSVDNMGASAGIFIGDIRIDQVEISKISCCGLGAAICAMGNCFIDACTFEKINTDGCCIGVYFAPKISVYTRFRQFVVADTPSYGFFFDGTDKRIYGADIRDMLLVRNCGSSPLGGVEAAAVYLKNVTCCIFSDNLIDAPGTFWFYPADATKNSDRQIHNNKAVGLIVEGTGNKIFNNTIVNSSAESMIIRGDNNILMNNVVDGEVIISGNNNVIRNLVFTSEKGKLILKGESVDSTDISGVDGSRIVKA